MEVEMQTNSISESLLQLTFEELNAVAGNMKVPVEQISKARTRRHLITTINKQMDELGENEEEHSMLAFLQKLMQFITSLSAADSNRTSCPLKFSRPGKQTDQAPQITIRKDFKILGQIGEQRTEETLETADVIHGELEDEPATGEGMETSQADEHVAAERLSKRKSSVREVRKPVMLTYDTLGEPRKVPRTVQYKQVVIAKDQVSQPKWYLPASCFAEDFNLDE